MNVLYANDEPGTYPDSYYLASAQPLQAFPPLAGEVSCDVCIIGAGYTGLSAALHLAESGLDVVVIDAHRIGWGASGRNGGQLSSALRLEQAELEKMVGDKRAMELWKLGRKANQLVKTLVRKHGIDCDLKPGVIHANHRKRYEKHSRLEADHLQGKYDYQEIRFIDQPEIRQILGTTAYFSGTLDMGAAHLHPLKFAFGLARAAEKAGVKFYEQTRATNLGKTDPAVVVTDNGRITARFVLVACNGYIGNLDNKIAARVMPINNFIVATEPLSDQLATEIIANDAAVADSKFVINYYRLSADRRLLFGGGENYSQRFPADIKSFVRKPMLEIYPQLENTRIDYGWGGTLGITMNRMPFLDRLAPNILTAGGYSGEGLGMGTYAGSLMAQVISGTVGQFDVLQSFPVKRFPGGRFAQKPLLALAMLYYSLRDRF
ncbi:MAG TPA: FAD-binding oxidoreductase [Rhizobiales bacterium]|nr:FAD-binding oxidoreductase [Hyphomicrobiales bacterium]